METTDPNILSDSAKKYLKVKSQVEILYSQSTITFIFPVIFAGLISVVIWDYAHQDRLLAWLSVVVIYAFVRYFILWCYTKDERTAENNQKWLHRFSLVAGLSGLMWGAAGIILIPYSPQDMVEFTLYNSLTMLTVCGLVAGAVATYSISMTTSLCYTAPALIPPALYMISLGDKYNSSLGGFILLYFCFITMAAYKLNAQLTAYAFRENEYQNIKQHYITLKKHYDKLKEKQTQT